MATDLFFRVLIGKIYGGKGGERKGTDISHMTHDPTIKQLSSLDVILYL